MDTKQTARKRLTARGQEPSNQPPRFPKYKRKKSRLVTCLSLDLAAVGQPVISSCPFGLSSLFHKVKKDEKERELKDQKVGQEVTGHLFYFLFFSFNEIKKMTKEQLAHGRIPNSCRPWELIVLCILY